MISKQMKTYISPEMTEVEINASELIATSPTDTTIPTTEPGDGDATDEGDFAAGSYRSSLWND